MQSPVLNRAEAVARLAAYEGEIRALGVIRLALFGSVLRGQTHADSDVDVLVQFAMGAKTYNASSHCPNCWSAAWAAGSS